MGSERFNVHSKLYGDQARFFDAEKVPRIKHRKKGTVSMVNNGSDQHGSQVRCFQSFSRMNFTLQIGARTARALEGDDISAICS